MRYFKFLITFFLLFLTLSGAVYAATPDGSSLANQINNQYGGPNRVTNNAVNPLMSGTPMTNISGSGTYNYNGTNYTSPSSFTSQLQCPSSKSFLQILFEPTSTQDFTAVISEDPGLTGNWTYSATSPLISGVCQNGFMSCPAGTFSNCQSYNWTINSAGDVSWALDDGSVNLGQCFCTNDSCNANVYNDFTDISDVFGQGLADYVSNALNDAISNVQSSYPTLTYYGQASADCTTVTSQSGGYTNPETYYSNPGAMSSAAQTEAATATASNSNNMASSQNLYYDISHDEYLSQNQTSTETCVIQNIPQVSQQEVYVPQFYSGSPISNNTVGVGVGGGASCANGSCWGSSSNTITLSTNNPQSTCNPEQLPGGITLSGSTMTGSGACSGTITISPTTGINPSGQIACNLGANGCNTGGTLYFSGYGGTLIISGSDNGQAGIPTTVNSTLSYTVSNGCQSIPSSCNLSGQQVCYPGGTGCVNTVSGYSKTGIAPQEDCRTLTGSLNGEQWNVCANGSAITYTGAYAPTSGTLVSGTDEWWYIENTYTCPVSNAIAPNMSRATAVNQSTTATSYTDSAQSSTTINGITYNNGGYNAAGTNALPGMAGNYAAMSVEMCEVVSPLSLSSGVTSDGSAIPNGSMQSNVPNGQGSVNNNYKWLTCTDTGTASSPSWNCPVPSGDTIVHDCEVYNGTNRAITSISVLNSMAQNTICSGN